MPKIGDSARAGEWGNGESCRSDLRPVLAVSAGSGAHSSSISLSAAWPGGRSAGAASGDEAGLPGAAATAGDTDKNDPNDALSVAIAALRSRTCRQVAAHDYPAVLKVWSKRHRDLGRTRNQVACRLHAVLCELVPGGLAKEISATQAARILAQAALPGVVELARAELAAEFLGNRGTILPPARPAHTPHDSSSKNRSRTRHHDTARRNGRYTFTVQPTSGIAAVKPQVGG